MSATHDLFSRWMKAQGLTSERAALHRLGLSPGTAQHWKAGRNAGLAILERMCRDLGEDAVPVALRAMEEQAATEADRKAWRRLAKRVGGSAVLALALAAGGPAGVPAASAEAIGDIHYAHRRKRPTKSADSSDTATEPGPRRLRGLLRRRRHDPSLPQTGRPAQPVRPHALRVPRRGALRSARAMGRLEAARRVARLA